MTNTDYLKKIGIEMKVSRIRKNLSIKQLSKLTGICTVIIYQIENGKLDSRILSYKRIADVLETEVKSFM